MRTSPTTIACTGKSLSCTVQIQITVFPLPEICCRNNAAQASLRFPKHCLKMSKNGILKFFQTCSAKRRGLQKNRLQKLKQ